MTEALKLGGEGSLAEGPRKIRRLNRLPIVGGIALVVVFLGVVFFGLTNRGLNFSGVDDMTSAPGSRPASTDADRIKKGVPDGIIGEPAVSPFQPTPIESVAEPVQDAAAVPAVVATPSPSTESTLEPEAVWRARLNREQNEQVLRELHRQRMAGLQAEAAAYDSPIAVEIGPEGQRGGGDIAGTNGQSGAMGAPNSALDLYAAALAQGVGSQNADPNSQGKKENFFNQDLAEQGYLPNRVVAQISPYELKRGSVIPATLVTGVNSDLPGRITAQVSQNVYDSATGHFLLVPQGSKLFGRYDSKVSFGQDRVLVIWTDLIFPNGSTLQIGGMAGTDAAGYGGFSDQVDNHYLQTFGSAILVALIGAGSDMMIPQDRGVMGQSSSAEDAARRSFGETFGKVSEQTVSRNLDVQPTLQIRPGYRFNVLVDQDLVFPGGYR